MSCHIRFPTMWYEWPAKAYTSLRIGSDKPAHICAYEQPDQSLCLSLEYSITLRLLTGHHLEILSLKGGCTGSSESILVKMPHCWKSHVVAHYEAIDT